MTDLNRRDSKRGAGRVLRAWLVALACVFFAMPAVSDPEERGETFVEDEAPRGRDRREDGEGPKAAPRATETRATELVPYVPRSRGKARHTAAGGTRTASNRGQLSVAVLAPNEIALTTRQQPTLYWYLSDETDARIDVTIADDEAIDPLLEMTLEAPIEGGIHSLDLAAHGVTLEPGRLYTWNVEIVHDAERRSNSLLAQGLIERIDATETLERSLREARARYAPYALSGIWYDALAELRAALAEDPTDRRLRRQEIALLEQIELPSVAQYVRREARPNR